MTFKHRILAILVILGVVASFLPTFTAHEDVYAASSTLTVSKDTYIRSGSAADVNYGLADHINIGVHSFAIGCGGEYERGLVEFGRPWGSLVPSGSTILSAYLELYYYASGGDEPAGQAILAQRLLRTGSDPWVETVADWNSYIIGNDWDSPGASGSGTDYTAADQASAFVPHSYGWMAWNVLGQVQTAQANDIDIAFRLYMPNEDACGCYGANCYEVKFYSGAYANSNYWPRLIISYIPPDAPTVGTIGATNVTDDSATLTGEVIDIGDATPTTRGIKYGLSQSDTWDMHEDGSFGAGEFSFNVTGLVPDSTYYWRAYAINAYGTGYGSWGTFTTMTGKPIVQTSSAYIYGIGTCLYANMAGTILNIGNSAVTRRGFEWGSTPSSASSDTYETGSFGAGGYSLTDFIGANQTYWFRAYAVNSEGTGYGIWKPFGTPEGVTDDCSGGGGANVTGSGTPEDPYVIWTVDGLQQMNTATSAYWELGCSINASETETWNGGDGFDPIDGFTGNFEGNNYTISGLHIDRNIGSVGLFGSMTAGTPVMQNLYIVDAYIKTVYTQESHANGGILIGAAYSDASPHVSRVMVSGTVYVEHTEPYGSPLHNAHAGGLIGFLWEGNAHIEECASYADVTGIQNGWGYCYAGGLIGGFGTWYGSSAYVKNSYARGDVQADIGDHYSAVAAGFIGYHNTNGSGGCLVQDSYSTGYISGESSHRGFMGSTDYPSQVTDCFWDLETSGTSSSAAGTGKTTAEMKIESTFTDAGWDFDDIWAIDSEYDVINDGYPYLPWFLTAEPEEGTEYTLTLSSNSGGNVTTPGEGNFDYAYGTIVDLEATPDEGYRFALWVGDTTEVVDAHSATTTVTVTGDFEIMAVFVVEGKLALYITSTAGGSVTDPGEGVFSYNPSEVVDLEATADGGYLFVMWTGDTDEIVDIYSSNTTITMLDDYTITANFATSGLNALSVSSTDGGDVIVPGEGKFEYEPDTVVDLVAQPNPDAWFLEWTGDVSTIDDVYNATTNITMSGNYSIVAEFGTSGTFNLTISSSTGGNVTNPGEGVFTYASGTAVNLMATADDGYEFFAWTGDVDTIDDAVSANTTITMNGNYVLVAEFAPFETCSLLIEVNPIEGGDITTPGVGAFIFPAGSLVQITAQAHEGWWFEEWTGNITNIQNPLSFNTTIWMLDDYAITANFVEEEAPPEAAPSVVTLNATDITSSSAWLNGELNSLGNYTQCNVFLQYGTTTDYGTNTRRQTRTATGAFSSWINNLAPNVTYHFRALCEYDDHRFVYGEDMEFTTTGAEECADCLWAGIQAYESHLTGDDDLAMVYGANWYGQTFTVADESHSVVDIRFLVYRVGVPSTITVSIRECGDDGLPMGEDLASGTFNGDSVTNSTGGSWYGVTLTETSLAYGDTYAIVVRAEAGDEDNYLAVRTDTDNGYNGGQAVASSSGGIIWTAEPDNDILFQVSGRALIRVREAKVFTNYLENGDALIVISYLNTYVPYYPDELASRRFWLQLRSANGDAVLSQTVCQQWGYMPGSIYLNANQAASLTYGWPYRIYLAGISAEEPVACYILTPEDWLGDAVELLCPWAITMANSMADYYGVAMTSQIQNREVLNSEGGTLFAAGIPSLVITNPDCFQDISYVPDAGTIMPGPTNFDTATTWEAQVGPVAARLANTFGGFMGGISGRHIIAGIFFIFYLAICYFVVREHADPIIATFLCIPILLGVAWLRVIDFQLIAAVGSVAVIMTVYRFHWSRT